MPRNEGKLAWWRRIGLGFILASAVIDFLPRHSAPYFRYTGSNPAHDVWNLGWPIVLAIYDPQSGVHLGPFLYAVIPVQGILSWLLFVLPRR